MAAPKGWWTDSVRKGINEMVSIMLDFRNGNRFYINQITLTRHYNFNVFDNNTVKVKDYIYHAR